MKLINVDMKWDKEKKMFYLRELYENIRPIDSPSRELRRILKWEGTTINLDENQEEEN